MTGKFRRRVIFGVAIVSAAAIAGAVAFFALRAQSSNKSGDQIVYSDDVFQCMGNTGFYYGGLNSDDEKYYFFDYKSRKSVVLCKRPNCNHTNKSSCDAYFPDITAFAQYNDKLYYLITNGANSSSIGSCDSDGSNKTVVQSINGEAGYQMLITGNKLFYERTQQQYKNSSAALNPVGNPKEDISVYDLSTHQNKVLTAIRTGIGASIILLGYYDHSVYYLYQDYKKKPDPKVAFNNNSLSYFKSLIGSNCIYRFDLRTGRETEILKSLNKFGLSFSLYQNSIFYISTDSATRVTSLYRYRLDTGRLQTVAAGKDLVGSFTCADGRVFYNRGVFNGKKTDFSSSKSSYAYRLADGNTLKAAFRKGNDGISVIGASGNLMILTVAKNEFPSGNSCSLSYAYIGKSDFYSGKLDYKALK